MAFVDEHDRVVGQILEQRRRRLAGIATREIARIVLDARARSGRREHLEIEDRALLEPLCLQQAVGARQLIDACPQLGLDAVDRLMQRRLRRHVVGVRVDLHEFQIGNLLAGERIELLNAFDLVAEQLDAPGAVLVVRGEEVDHVAAHAERAALEVHIGAAIHERDEIGDQRALADLLALLQGKRHLRIGLDRADAVDAGHGRDDDDVVAFQERARRRVTHAVDLLVHRRILLDVGVGARDVGFRLVIVVVADEVLDGVVRKEALELAVELGGKRLVRGEDQRGPLRARDHLRHGVGLAGTGDAEQHLRALVRVGSFHQLFDRGRLVPLRLVRRHELEALATFGFLRPVGTMRNPDLVPEFRATLIDERLQRLRGSGGTERRNVVGVTVVREAEFRGELGIEPGYRRRIEMPLRPLGHAVADAAGGAIGLLGFRLFRFGRRHRSQYGAQVRSEGRAASVSTVSGWRL